MPKFGKIVLECVRDHIPLEQGSYSIRTRIKTVRHGACEYGFRVRDHIPLEQGLRHSGLYRRKAWKIKSETIFH